MSHFSVMVVQLPDHVFMARPDSYARILPISDGVAGRHLFRNMPHSDTSFYSSSVHQIALVDLSTRDCEERTCMTSAYK